jgi:hypothetical protein
MRLKVGIVQNARDAAVAYVDALAARVLTEERGRPMRDR